MSVGLVHAACLEEKQGIENDVQNGKSGIEVNLTKTASLVMPTIVKPPDDVCDLGSPHFHASNQIPFVEIGFNHVSASESVAPFKAENIIDEETMGKSKLQEDNIMLNKEDQLDARIPNENKYVTETISKTQPPRMNVSLRLANDPMNSNIKLNTSLHPTHLAPSPIDVSQGSEYIVTSLTSSRSSEAERNSCMQSPLIENSEGQCFVLLLHCKICVIQVTLLPNI